MLRKSPDVDDRPLDAGKEHIIARGGDKRSRLLGVQKWMQKRRAAQARAQLQSEMQHQSIKVEQERRAAGVREQLVALRALAVSPTLLALPQRSDDKECTFQPNVSISKKHVPERGGPVIVRGLGRHLELKEMAKKQEEERLSREEEVFKTQPRQPARTAGIQHSSFLVGPTAPPLTTLTFWPANSKPAPGQPPHAAC